VHAGYLGCYVEPVCGNLTASVFSLLEQSSSMTVARCNALGLLYAYKYISLQVGSSS
jgi:hypothetical protein